MDSRRFFSAGIDVRGNLTQSLLGTTYKEIVAGIVQAHLNVPYAELLGQASGELSYSIWKLGSGGDPYLSARTGGHQDDSPGRLIQVPGVNNGGANGSPYPSFTVYTSQVGAQWKVLGFLVLWPVQEEPLLLQARGERVHRYHPRRSDSSQVGSSIYSLRCEPGLTRTWWKGKNE
jgi:hypothetical protein